MRSLNLILAVLAVNDVFTNARRIKRQKDENRATRVKHLQTHSEEALTNGTSTMTHELGVLGQNGSSSVGSSPTDTLNLVWAEWARKECIAYPNFLLPLIQGVINVDQVESLTWTPPEDASDGHGQLKLQLVAPRLYGEISSRSRVPVMWTLEQQVSFTFTDSTDAKGQATKTVLVKGFGTQPSKEAFDLYRQLVTSSECKKAGCAPTNCAIDLSSKKMAPCVKAEVDAAGSFLSNVFGSPFSWSGVKGLSNKKIGQILKNSYASKKMNLMASGKWGQIFYSLITAATTKVTSFVVQADGTIYTTVDNVPDPEKDVYVVNKKAQHMGAMQMKSNAKFMSLAIKSAKSGMSMGLMMAHGNPIIKPMLEEMGLPGAKPVDVGNVLAQCALALDNCKGKTRGRLHWTTFVPDSFQ